MVVEQNPRRPRKKGFEGRKVATDLAPRWSLYFIRSLYLTYRLSDSQPCKDIRLGKFRPDDVTYSFDLSDSLLFKVI